MRDRDRYLKRRGERYFYYRRVPTALRTLDPRGTIRIALKTPNITEARLKRDQLEAADTLFWSALRNGDGQAALQRYTAAVERAIALGYNYAPAPELAETAPLKSLVKRIETIPSPKDLPTAQAVLGHVERPRLRVTEALEVYINEINAARLTTKSPAQYHSWLLPKKRAVENFVKVVGDLPLEDITREHGRTFYQWWLNRVVPPKDSDAAPLKADSAMRDIGNMRNLFATYTAHIGQDHLPNPFRNFSITVDNATERHPFTPDWITSRILAPGALDGLNDEARLIVFAMIETGARPSEIANLLPEQIVLDAPVPFIAIKSTEHREIKTKPSRREIPLLGISLEAMRRARKGFPRYYDRDKSLSATLSKYFRSNGLFPTKNHVIYSFRHSFEKRMTEAGLDFGLRCVLMGHSTKRPVYGDGGSLAYRRDELAKIVLPYSPDLLEPEA